MAISSIAIYFGKITIIIFPLFIQHKAQYRAGVGKNKFGIRPKFILPLDGRPEHCQKII